ncbi:hypothetical protein CHU98_g11409 [Xylaria longipes]|nr:hypothetical protein CHU98_g11409 [Xylaria longipes]
MIGISRSIILAQLSGLAIALHCRCLPSDSCWPSKSHWSQLNATVEGRLTFTIPLAALFHTPNYNKDACETLKSGWPYAQTHIPSSSSFSSPIAQNQSCSPFTEPESECLIGNYLVYAVNASTADHVAAAIRFASHHNIRLIIKSTGHDLMGRSSGAGSLSIWMHSFQNLTITKNYTGLNTYNDYRGPAVRIEPGLLAYQIFEAARDEGLRVIGGTCPTVSIGGGYTTGGGHGLLASKYGFGADNVLEWDVVTASGTRITATPDQNADLYWALSGGGPGVFAVIIGVTVKAFPDGEVSTAALTFKIKASPSEDAFWSAVETFHSYMPTWLDRNATVAYVYSSGTFSLQPLTLPDQPADSVHTLLAPFLSRIEDIGVPYTLNITTFPNFLESYAAYQGPLPYGIIPSAEVQASRLLPRSLLESEDKVHAF